MCPVILPDYFMLIPYPFLQRNTLALFLFLRCLMSLTGKLFRLLSLRFSLSLFFCLLLLLFNLSILIRLNRLSGATAISTFTAGTTIYPSAFLHMKEYLLYFLQIWKLISLESYQSFHPYSPESSAEILHASRK